MRSWDLKRAALVLLPACVLSVVVPQEQGSLKASDEKRQDKPAGFAWDTRRYQRPAEEVPDFYWDPNNKNLITFPIPCTECSEEVKEILGDESITVSIRPADHEAPCSSDKSTGVTINGHPLNAEAVSPSGFHRFGRQRISSLTGDGEGLRGLFDISCGCLSGNSFLSVEDCEEPGYIMSMFLGLENGKALHDGFTLSYKQDRTPEIVRFSPFASRAIADDFLDVKDTPHWSSPSLVSSPQRQETAVEEPAVALTVPTPTASLTVTSTPTSSAPYAYYSNRHGAHDELHEETHAMHDELEPYHPTILDEAKKQTDSEKEDDDDDDARSTFQPSKQKVFSFSSVASELKEAFAKIQSLNPCPIHQQSLVHQNITRSHEGSEHYKGPSMPTPPSAAARALIVTAVLSSIVTFSTLAFVLLRRNPRQLADLAAKREEKQNKALFRRAAKQLRWRRWWAKRTAWLRKASAEEADVEKPIFARTSISSVRAWSVTSTTSETLVNDVSEKSSVGPNGLPESFSQDLEALRDAHCFVEGVLKAEAARVKGRQQPDDLMVYTAATKAAAAVAASAESRSANRRSRAYSDAASEKSMPLPPYREREYRSTPASSIFITSPPESDYESSINESDREEKDSGNFSEKE